jgi:hypothetical protein
MIGTTNHNYCPNCGQQTADDEGYCHNAYCDEMSADRDSDMNWDEEAELDQNAIDEDIADIEQYEIEDEEFREDDPERYEYNNRD